MWKNAWNKYSVECNISQQWIGFFLHLVLAFFLRELVKSVLMLNALWSACAWIPPKRKVFVVSAFYFHLVCWLRARASARQILFCLKWSERDLLQCNIRSRHHHHRRPLDDFTIVGVSIQLNRSCIIWWPLEMIIPWFLMDFNLSCGAVFGLKNWQETTGQKKDNSDQSSFEFSFNTQWTFILFAHLPFRFQQLHKMFEMRSLSQKCLLNGFFFVFFCCCWP